MEQKSETGLRASVFRFSLRGLLLATAVIGLLASHFVTSLKLRSVTAENRLLKQELNRLPLEDARLLHVAALQSADRLVWRWRLHVPKDGKFVLRTESSNLPESGLPTNLGQVGDQLPVGDVLVAVSIYNEGNEQWSVVTFVPAPQVRSRFPIPKANATWIDEKSSIGSRQMGIDGVKAVPRGEAAVLLRARKSKKVAGGVTVDMNPTDGVMVWIEEQ